MSEIQPITIDTMVNNNGLNIGDRLNFISCEQTSNVTIFINYFVFSNAFNKNIARIVVREGNVFSRVSLSMVEWGIPM